MTDPAAPLSPLDALEAEMKHSLRAAALGVERRLSPLEGALSAYRRALEALIAKEFALAHSLHAERPSGPSSKAAARALRDLVLALPELREADAVTAADRDLTALGSPEPTRVEPPRPATTKSVADVLPHVMSAADGQMLVIVGALAGRKRDLPEPLGDRTEWIDTSQGGAHAVGNLPTRIRQGRVLGVVICEGVISHKHSEPVVQAARTAGIPVGFAGKGGSAGIARALRSIDGQLAETAENSTSKGDP